MLLPSAFGCDSSGPVTRYQSSNFNSHSLLASPPLSPQSTTATTIFSTCRALQSMLSTPNQLPNPLPSPPTTYSAMPTKLRLRARKTDNISPSVPRRKITKRAVPAARGENKRCRADDDEMAEAGSELNEDENENTSVMMEHELEQRRPSTPKRQRIAPEVLPLGLERSDYHTLHLQQAISASQPQPQPLPLSIQYPVIDFLQSRFQESNESREEKEEEWTNEDDRMLVELVLEKLKLSKSEWQDCARSLGRERGNVGRRWKSLVGAGEIGVRRTGRERGRICGSWR